MTAISVINVNKSFGETRALQGASLKADLGEIHAIVGENGSGKSTLAKILSGVVLADSGQVDVLGGAPASPTQAIANGISTIFQEMMLAEELSVWENVFAGADGFWKRTSSVADKKARTKEIIERLADCDVDPNAPVSSLPLNVKQWLVIARALLQKPKVLIFDESSAALDLEATNRLHEEMLAVKAAGTCVVIVTHRIAELVKIADGATVLRDGATVGRLERSEMTEENLLQMMSASHGHSARGSYEKRIVSSAQKPALEASGIVLADGKAPVDFKVFPGEIVGVAGLDGAGQADFVRNLSGIFPPKVGQVQVWEDASTSHVIDTLAAAEAADITYVSGDRKREGIFPNLSILENFGLALYDRVSTGMGLIDREKLQHAFVAEQDRLSIKFGSKTDKITTLSGGNQQKVLIARAFAVNPKVIVLNDPARGVDIGTKQDLYRHLREFAANGGAVVYLSTEIEEFFDFADRADVFFEGSLFASFDESQINEENLLAAMFGQSEPVEFDKSLNAEGAA